MGPHSILLLLNEISIYPVDKDKNISHPKLNSSVSTSPIYSKLPNSYQFCHPKRMQEAFTSPIPLSSFSFSGCHLEKLCPLWGTFASHWRHFSLSQLGRCFLHLMCRGPRCCSTVHSKAPNAGQVSDPQCQ